MRVEQKIRCSRCKGEGLVPASPSSGFFNEEMCPACSGTGCFYTERNTVADTGKLATFKLNCLIIELTFSVQSYQPLHWSKEGHKALIEDIEHLEEQLTALKYFLEGTL